MGVKQAVGWGLWGSGRISHQVAQDMRLVAGARIVAVGSRRLDAAQQFAALHRGATAHDTLAQLIGQPGVDALYVATPDGCHRDDVLAALAAGKAVLCEKPLATSPADVQMLVDAAAR
jgi:predicted dehydrogenase